MKTIFFVLLSTSAYAVDTKVEVSANFLKTTPEISSTISSTLIMKGAPKEIRFEKNKIIIIYK